MVKTFYMFTVKKIHMVAQISFTIYASIFEYHILLNIIYTNNYFFIYSPHYTDFNIFLTGELHRKFKELNC